MINQSISQMIKDIQSIMIKKLVLSDGGGKSYLPIFFETHMNPYCHEQLEEQDKYERFYEEPPETALSGKILKVITRGNLVINYMIKSFGTKPKVDQISSWVPKSSGKYRKIWATMMTAKHMIHPKGVRNLQVNKLPLKRTNGNIDNFAWPTYVGGKTSIWNK
jgi:hypothetical protein